MAKGHTDDKGVDGDYEEQDQLKKERSKMSI